MITTPTIEWTKQHQYGSLCSNMTCRVAVRVNSVLPRIKSTDAFFQCCSPDVTLFSGFFNSNNSSIYFSPFLQCTQSTRRNVTVSIYLLLQHASSPYNNDLQCRKNKIFQAFHRYKVECQVKQLKGGKTVHEIALNQHV